MVCPFTTLFTLVPVSLPLPSLVIFVNVHALEFHTLVFLVTAYRSLQLLDSVLLNKHYQLHLLCTSTWSYLTETNNSSIQDALTFYLLGNHWLLYLDLYAHKNLDILTAQTVASTPRSSALPSTRVTVTTSSSPTVTSCTSNVSEASRSWNSNAKGSSHTSLELSKRLVLAPWHYFPYIGSLTIHGRAPGSSHFLFVPSLLFLNCSFIFYLFCLLILSLFVPRLKLLFFHFIFHGLLHVVHARSWSLKTTVVPMVPIFKFCLPQIITETIIWFLSLRMPPSGTTFTLVWLNTSVSILSLVFIKLMNWTKSSIVCPCVERLFDFLFVLLFFSDPDDHAPNVASQQSSSMSSGATVMPTYFCFLPTPFDGTTDFEDFVTHFNSVAALAAWENFPSDDLRPQLFSAHLSRDTLSFFCSLTWSQQTNLNRLLHAFRHQYAPNQDVLRAEVKTVRQQP